MTTATSCRHCGYSSPKMASADPPERCQGCRRYDWDEGLSAHAAKPRRVCRACGDRLRSFWDDAVWRQRMYCPGCTAEYDLEDERSEMKKSKLMLRVERGARRPLEQLLPEMINEHGMSGAAELLGISKACLGYWALKLGIQVRRVALAPGDTLEVKRVE